MFNSIKKIALFLLFPLLFLNMQCDEDRIVDDSFCDFIVFVDELEYYNLNSSHFTWIEAAIYDDCLSVRISASGCSGESWGFSLVDSGAIAESSPEQRFLKFALENNEACLAVFDRVITFDLTPLQIEGSNEILLNIEGFPNTLTYKY